MAGLTQLHALAVRLDERARARGFAFAHLTVGYMRVGAQERAAECYSKLLPFRGQFSPILVDRALGLAAFAGGNRAAMQRHLAEAEADTRRADMRPELALTLLYRGMLEHNLHMGGAASSATTAGPLAAGLKLCAELGMEELAKRILSPSATTPTTGAPRGRGAYMAGLSDRELEVLRLVVQGHKNREIAETLVLSEKTVARHLTNIFTKIGVENRASATAFALRHGLA